MSLPSPSSHSVDGAPIHKLPNEILVSVFTFGLQSGEYDFEKEATPFPVLISAVCTRWRRLVITSPDLWASISIFSRATLHTAKLFLERSRPCLFELTLHPCNSGETEQAISLVAPHILRMRSLVFEYVNIHELNLLASAFSACPASGLQSLKIWMLPGHGWRCSEHSDLHTSLFKGTDSLRSLTLYGLCSRLAPPLVDLSHLEICHFSPTYTELRDLFVACPCLTTLCLPTFLPVERIGETEASPLIEASSLRALSVGLGLHNDVECECLLSLLKMDNLEHLEITGVQGRYCNLARHFTSRCKVLGNVRTLRLQGVVFSTPKDDAAFYGSLVSLTRLELIDVESSDRILESGKDKHESEISINFPRLSTVLVSTQWVNEFAQLVDTLCARGLSGRLNQLIVPLTWIVTPSDLSKLKAARIEVLYVNNEGSRGLAQYDPSSSSNLIDDELNGEWDDELWYDGDDFDYDHDGFGSDEEFYEGSGVFGDFDSDYDEIF